ncbi:hypothetical protein D3C75_1250610 [compost metagenome]
MPPLNTVVSCREFILSRRFKLAEANSNAISIEKQLYYKEIFLKPWIFKKTSGLYSVKAEISQTLYQNHIFGYSLPAAQVPAYESL